MNLSARMGNASQCGVVMSLSVTLLSAKLRLCFLVSHTTVVANTAGGLRITGSRDFNVGIWHRTTNLSALGGHRSRSSQDVGLQLISQEFFHHLLPLPVVMSRWV